MHDLLQSPQRVLVAIYVFGLPALWALIVGIDIARKLRPSRFAEWKAAAEFALGVLIVPLLELVLAVASTKLVEAAGRRVSGEAALRLMSVVTLPFALVAVWALLSVPLFRMVARSRWRGTESERRGSDRERSLAVARTR